MGSECVVGGKDRVWAGGWVQSFDQMQNSVQAVTGSATYGE